MRYILRLISWKGIKQAGFNVADIDRALVFAEIRESCSGNKLSELII